jgi:hypothetical protein
MRYFRPQQKVTVNFGLKPTLSSDALLATMMWLVLGHLDDHDDSVMYPCLAIFIPIEL